MSNDRVVWVVGAGFSRSLGGPLLDDLFTSPWTARCQAFGSLGDDVESKRASDLGRWYEANPYGDAKLNPWRDAEEFLELVAEAALRRRRGDDENPAWALLRAHGSRVSDPSVDFFDDENGPNLMERSALRLLSASCDFFADSRTVTGVERWSPYRRFRDELQRHTVARHTVVTFNYDRVFEKLGEPFAIVPPTVTKVEMEQAMQASSNPGERRIDVLKLHGSLDWSRRDDGRIVDERPRGAIPGICAPGPAKADDASVALAGLWAGAAEALRRATTIVFVGYRFPPSDAQAKEHLLGALRGCHAGELNIRIILGPDTAHADVQRMIGMLKWALAGRQIVMARDVALRSHVENSRPLVVIDPTPMYAQDFFAVFDPHQMDQAGFARGRTGAALG